MEFLTNEQKHAVEAKVGLAALETIANFEFQEEEPENAVWKLPGITGDYDQIKKHFEW